jgi:GMP synthase PP-ATPase subunit
MEKIPNLYKIRQIMYPEPEIYTLQDMMEEEYPESPLDDALWQAFRNTDASADLNEKNRTIELTVDADAVLTVDAMKAYSQQVSDAAQGMGEQVVFVGIQGGVDMRVGLVFRY